MKLTLCYSRLEGCITFSFADTSTAATRAAGVLNLIFCTGTIDSACVGVSSTDRKMWRGEKNDSRTVYNISEDINFSWSGYSFYHIHHSCTVTRLSPADPLSDTHATIKNPSLLRACRVDPLYCSACPAQGGRQPELLKCSSVQFI